MTEDFIAEAVVALDAGGNRYIIMEVGSDGHANLRFKAAGVGELRQMAVKLREVVEALEASSDARAFGDGQDKPGA